MELRYFSGKYDSIKQKSTFLNLHRPEQESWIDLYLYYTATIRMEMFFTEKIILTDALWYDGAYFSSILQKPDEFAGFSNFLQRNPVIEVRRRENYVARMFGKGFEFSSLIQDSRKDNSFSKSVFEFGASVAKETQKPFKTMEEYAKMLREYINKNAANHLDQCEHFVETLLALDRIEGVDFQQWDKERERALPNAFDAISPLSLKGYGEVSNRMALSALYDEYICDYDVLKESSAEFKALINNDFPNRTGIVNFLKGKNGKLNEDDPRLMSIYNKFNAIYSRGLAEQHHCSLFDGMEDGSAVNRARRENRYKIDLLDIPQQIVRNIGACSWDHFAEIFNSASVTLARNAWINEYSDVQKNPNDRESSEARGVLEDYAKVILYSFDGVKDYVFNSSVFYDRNNGDTYIGSASNEFETFGNDICLFIPNPNRKDRIIRLFSRSGRRDADQCLDTIIAFPKEFTNMLNR